jgi:hypothetical protein
MVIASMSISWAGGFPTWITTDSVDLKESVLHDCISLKCDYLPASVESIPALFVASWSHFAFLGYECGSNVNPIADLPFWNCR